MSRRVRWTLLALLSWSVTAPASVAARQTDEELRARLDSLTPLIERAEADVARAAAREEAERIANGTAATDTIMVGPLRVIARRGQADKARQLVGDVWNGEYTPFMGTLSHQPTLTFAWPSGDRPIRLADDTPERRVEMVGWRSSAAVKQLIRKQIAAILGVELAGSNVGAWINGEVRVRTDPAELYRMTAMAGAESTRACLEGVARRCWDALAADLTEDPFPLDEWYSPEERVEMMRSQLQPALSRWRGDEAALDRLRADERVIACAERASVPDCDALMANRRYYTSPLQLVGPRAHLVWIALNAGGAGAWDRLTANPETTPGDALRAASGLGTDRLAELWRTDVVESRVDPLRVLDPDILLALVWMGIFVTLAMRSTRWRLG